MTTPTPPPQPSPIDQAHVVVLLHFLRLQLPGLRFTEEVVGAHLRRTYTIYRAKTAGELDGAGFLRELYAADWGVCVGCLEGQLAAWELLFTARAGRGDYLLVDALRARAVRLYPRDEERQESAVAEFWSSLIVPETEGGTAVLGRYDGQRPLVPWLIRVFQNAHLSKLRHSAGTTPLPDDDLALPLEPRPEESDPAGRWRRVFVDAARDWLAAIDDEDRLLLGLRWRYRLSQREVAKIFGLHEGTLTRRTDKLRDQALARIGAALRAEGWTGDDLSSYVLSELGAVLTDDPRLSADHLARLLAAKGKQLPA